MAIPFTTSEGAITRLGGIGGLTLNVTGFLGTQPTNTTATWGSAGVTVKNIGTALDTLDGRYASTSQSEANGLYQARDDYRNGAHSGYLEFLRDFASRTLVRMAYDDVTTVDDSIDTAMGEFITQMVAVPHTVKKNTTSVSVAAASGNTGNPTVFSSIVGPNGVNREYVYAEAIEVIVDTDEGHGGTAGSETATISGEIAAAGLLAWDWPKGSGARGSLTIIDPAVDAGTNLLTNSDFEDFTGGLPDEWDVIIGDNTTIGSGGSSFLPDGTTCLKFIGDGSELTTVRQSFADAVLEPNTVYPFWSVSKVSAVPSGGVLAFSFANASSHAVVNDDASTANTVSVDLTLETTSFAVHTGFFRTPKVLPTAGIELRIKLTTALESAKSVLFHCALGEAVDSIYPGGPYIAAARGSTDVILKDKWTVTAANDYGGMIQNLFWRWFDMPNLDLGRGRQLPSASSPTLANSWVI